MEGMVGGAQAQSQLAPSPPGDQHATGSAYREVGQGPERRHVSTAAGDVYRGMISGGLGTRAGTGVGALKTSELPR